MDLSKTLAALDTMLSGPKVTPMTKAQFETYAQDQIAKAKAEAEDEDDKEVGAKKAKKRLEHLRSTMATLSKAEGTPLAGAWTGDNGTALIPEFDHGFEDTTRKTEVSETEVKTPPAGNQGTQGDGNSAFAGAAPSYDQQAQPFPKAGTQMPASGAGTQNDNTMFEQGAVGKALADLQKTLGTVAAKAGDKAAQDDKKDAKKSDFQWPADLTATEEVIGKDAVAKRHADHWGKDTSPAAK